MSQPTKETNKPVGVQTASGIGAYVFVDSDGRSMTMAEAANIGDKANEYASLLEKNKRLVDLLEFLCAETDPEVLSENADPITIPRIHDDIKQALAENEK